MFLFFVVVVVVVDLSSVLMTGKTTIQYCKILKKKKKSYILKVKCICCKKKPIYNTILYLQLVIVLYIFKVFTFLRCPDWWKIFKCYNIYLNLIKSCYNIPYQVHTGKSFAITLSQEQFNNIGLRNFPAEGLVKD